MMFKNTPNLSKLFSKWNLKYVSNPQELDDCLVSDSSGIEWIFFPHWSWIIPDETLSQYSCVIFHMTDVPYGRGGSPLQNLIIRGHKTTMLTALKCVSSLDAGPVYLKESLDLSGTADEILSRSAKLMPIMIKKIIENNIEPVAQVGEVEIFKRRKPSEGNIKNLETLDQVYDVIRMLDGEGYPPAFFETSNLRIEITKARQADENYIEALVRIRRKI